MAVLVALAPALSFASSPRLPPAGVGLVGLSVGYRMVPDAPFAATAAKAGRPMSSHAFGAPTALVPFSYRGDGGWSLVVELGYGSDHYQLADAGAVDLQTVTLQAGAQWAFDLGLDRLEPFAEAGVGYYLSTFTASGGPQNVEANSSGGFLGAGLRYALTDEVGLTLEERYALATVNLAGVADASVGGDTVALGMYYVWREEPDGS